MSKERKKIDMTTGPIMRNVFLFAIPIILGNVLQQLYTTVDTLIVGKYCGDTSLAAIGTSAQPVEVLLCIFMGIGVGVSILISQYIGAKATEKMRNVCSTSICFVYVCGVLLSIAGYFLAPYLLKLMGVPEDTWNGALIYTRIVFLGTLGNIGYNMNSGILRGMGDSKASLWFLVVSCVTNIILDILFVATFHMDIQGAGIATIVAMYLSWIVSIFYIKKRFPELQFTFLPRKYVGEEMKNILMLGLPIGLNHSLYSFGHMVLQTMVNAQGSVFMAGASVAGRITGIANVAITALSSAATTFSGQNYGAKRIDRLKQGYLRIPFVSGAVTLCFGLLFLTIHRPILGLFSQDTQVLDYASRYVAAILLSQWCYAIFNGIINIANGVGQMRYATIVSIVMLWVVRIPSAYLIMKYIDGTWIMLCYPISFVFGMICMFGYYLFSKRWKAILAGEE